MFLTWGDWIILLLTPTGCLLIYCYWVYGYFSRRGVMCIKPKIPLFGNMFDFLTRRKHSTEVLTELYNKYPGEKYVGYYEFLNPIIMIRDVDLLKQTCVKDFNNFLNHRTLIDFESIDSPFAKHLMALTGQNWKDMRSTLSPAFTASKMRNMFSFMVECSEETSEYYLKKCHKTEGSIITIEMKDAISKFTTDVIASCVFGIKVNSLQDPNNLFIEMGKKSTDFSVRMIFKVVFYAIFPNLSDLLGISVFNKEASQFFRNLVQETIKEREVKGIIREDMMHLLIQAKKGSLKHEDNADKCDTGFATAEDNSLNISHPKREWTDDDLTAQAIIFFVAGFDTSSTLLSFLAMELVANPDVQTKLQKEIDQVKSELNGKLNYNDLVKLKYLDMVISETLRRWPPVVTTDRESNKSYTLPAPRESGKEYQLKKGCGVSIPIYAIHHDPEFYPNPTKFDPERFSDENKSSINPYTFIPFGVGPRNCIGSRFALMQLKSIVFYMLSTFDFCKTCKTELPIQLSKDTVLLKLKNGSWIGLRPRSFICSTRS